MSRIVPSIAALSALVLPLIEGATDIDWSRVDEVIGKKGVDLPGGVHTAPR